MVVVFLQQLAEKPEISQIVQATASSVMTPAPVAEMAASSALSTSEISTSAQTAPVAVAGASASTLASPVAPTTPYVMPYAPQAPQAYYPQDWSYGAAAMPVPVFVPSFGYGYSLDGMFLAPHYGYVPSVSMAMPQYSAVDSMMQQPAPPLPSPSTVAPASSFPPSLIKDLQKQV